MAKPLKRILIGLAVGLGVCLGGLWGLVHLLDEGVRRYQGQPGAYWVEQANGRDSAASNRACAVIHTVIIPQLVETMVRDTNDSRLRLALIDQLNKLPGVQIYYSFAAGRRAAAIGELGQMGPLAKETIPELLRVLKGNDPPTRPPAALALGQIQSQPETIIPLLTSLVDDPQEGVPEAAIEALGRFGSLSKAAVPKLLPLLKVQDKDLHRAVTTSLKQIDPETAAAAGLR